MATGQTDFSGYTTGTGVPSGWSTKWYSLDVTWTIVEDAAVFGGKYLKGDVHNLATVTYRWISWDTIGTNDDTDVICRFKIPSSGPGTLVAMIAKGGGTNSDRYGYVLDINYNFSNNVKFYVRKYAGGSSPTSILINQYDIGRLLDYSKWHYVRFKVSGQDVYVRIWSEDESQPASWTQTANDGGAALSAGWSAIAVVETAPNTYYDWLSYGTSTDAAADPPEPTIIDVPAATFSFSAQVPAAESSIAVPAASFAFATPTPRAIKPAPTGVMVQPIYRCYLTGNADDLVDYELPISSFQTRQVSAKPSYLQIVINNLVDYIDGINARPNGDIVVKRGYRVIDTGEEVLEEIARANLEGVRTDQGGRNQSITLTGHKQKTYNAPIAVNLSGATYRSSDNGTLRFRCTPDNYLRPGDTANINNESLVVTEILITVGPSQETMEISG